MVSVKFADASKVFLCGMVLFDVPSMELCHTIDLVRMRRREHEHD